MVNYQNAKIYQIICNITGERYIGSTCNTFSKRLSQHKTILKCSSKQIIERGDYDMVLIEDCPCDNKNQLHAHERYYIDNMDCVNNNVPGRTRNEWREVNREVLSEKDKQRYEANRESIVEKKKIKITCECGVECRKDHLARHKRSKHHQLWENENI